MLSKLDAILSTPQEKGVGPTLKSLPKEEPFKPKLFSNLREAVSFLAQHVPNWQAIKRNAQQTPPQRTLSPAQLPALAVRSEFTTPLPRIRGGQFSRTPRFAEGPMDRVACQTQVQVRSSLSEVKTRVFRNKCDVFKHSPKCANDRHSAATLSRAIIEQLCLQRKRHIEAADKLEKQRKLEGKARRLRIRTFPDKYAALTKALCLQTAVFGVCSVIKNRVRLEKVHRKRARHLLKLLFYSCRFVGKTRAAVRRHRRTQAQRVLRKLFVPIVVLRIAQKRRRRLELLDRLMDSFINSASMSSLLFKWRQTLSVVKKHLKSLIAVRRARFAVLMAVWDRYNEERARLKDASKHLSIPLSVKRHYIHRFLTNRFRVYAKQYARYHEHWHNLRHNWEYKYEHERALLLNLSVEVKKPSLNVFRCLDKLRQLVVEADINRVNWERIRTALKPPPETPEQTLTKPVVEKPPESPALRNLSKPPHKLSKKVKKKKKKGEKRSPRRPR